MHPAHPGLYTLEWHFPQQPLDQSSDNSSRKCLRFRCRLSMWYCLRHWDREAPAPIFNPITNDCSQQSEETPRKCAIAARHSVASDKVSEEAGGSLEIQRKTRRRMARERRGAGSSLVSMETQFYKQYMKDVL